MSRKKFDLYFTYVKKHEHQTSEDARTHTNKYIIIIKENVYNFITIILLLT